MIAKCIDERHAARARGYDPYNSADQPQNISAVHQSRKFGVETEMPFVELLAMRCSPQELSDAIALQLKARKRLI